MLAAIREVAQLVSFSARHRSFVYKNKALAGVTALLGDAYYPFYRRAVSKKPEDASLVAQTTKDNGWKRGSLVDSQLASIVNGKRVRTMHKMTERVLQAFRFKSWTPIAAQVPVYDLESRIGTAVDVLCTSQQGHLLVVEVKIGYANGAHDAGKGALLPPFGAFTDCPKNQHFLQLAATLELFQKTYNRRAYGILLRADEAAVHIHRLPDVFTSHELMPRLASAAKDRREARAQARAARQPTVAHPRPKPRANAAAPAPSVRRQPRGPQHAKTCPSRVGRSATAHVPKPRKVVARQPQTAPRQTRG